MVLQPREIIVLPYARKEMEDHKNDNRSKRMVFVTVGTTSFDALVRAIDTNEVKEELCRRGYTHLLIQIGRGKYTPSKVK